MAEKQFRIIRERSEMGRSSLDLECPFCGTEVTAFKWSLAGSGKRCECGAKFSWKGLKAVKENGF